MKKLWTLCTLALVPGCILLAQNVGVGTTAPVLPLHVSRSTDTALLLLENRASLGVNTNVGMYFKNGVYYTGGLRTVGTNAGYSRLSLLTYASTSPNTLQERLSITDDGKVGIGTTAPGTQLQVSVASDSALLILERQSDIATGSSTGMYFKNGNRFTGAIKTIGSGTSAARLSFYTYASTATTGLSERLSIRDDGNVGINSSNPSAQLEVVGTSKFSMGTDNVAVEVAGPIKVSGNYKPAFVLTCSSGNLTDIYQPIVNYTANATYYASVIIDNPLCNFDPNAIVMVTAQTTPVPFAVVYDANISKWKITVDHNSVKEDNCFGVAGPVNQSCGSYARVFMNYQPVTLSVGQKFNVMVFKQ